ncbi:MAG: helix-turn-helix transcriptional regulator [Veillonellaceae bacterium]|nr:helix-turn-helix transcriptional regulator [Veillonellaceae bacterium]
MSTYNPKALYIRKPIRKALEKVWEYPLTVIEAPMGYGKTTAVREYLKNCKAKVLWQTVADDSISGFWNGFCRLIAKLNNQCAISLIDLGAPTSSICREESLDLITGLVFSRKTVIVIDDYHLLSCESIDKFFECLIKKAHPNLHIIVISREMFSENTAELMLKGYCYLIDKRNFEFTQDEIIEYYKLCGVQLKQQEASALYAYTEGWVSALYLCMLSIMQEGRIECQATLHELIEKVVYRNCSPELKAFLEVVCIFDSFSLKQAKAMWNKDNAEVLLCQLVAKNAFTTYDNVSKTYQIHNVFTSFLRDLLDRQEEKKQRSIYAMAGEWYLSVRDYINAMHYFYKAADFDKLLTVFELDRGESINNSHREMLLRYFAECPTAIKRQHPLAVLFYVSKLFLFNEKELYTVQYKELIEDIGSIQDEEKRNWLLGELAFSNMFTRYNDLNAMAEQASQASQLLKGPSRIFNSNSAWNFGAPSILYLFYRCSGELEKQAQQIMELIHRYCQITAGHGAGGDYVMQAERYYYCGDFENAEINNHKAMYIAGCHQQLGIMLCAMFLQIRLALIKGDLSSALDVLQQMRSEVKKNRKYMYVDLVDMCEGYIYSCLGQAYKIPNWILHGQLQESRLHYPCYAFFNIIYGRGLLLKGEYTKLLGIATQFISIASVFPHLLGHVYTYIYMAAAHYRLNHYQEGQAALKKAIDIAAPDQLIMPFVENGDYISNILIDLAQDGNCVEFIGHVRKVYASVSKNVEGMIANIEQHFGITRLTARELEIAELVAQGLSNHIIATKLSIAEVTVKKALQKIYAKLGIGSRAVLVRLFTEQKKG